MTINRIPKRWLVCCLLVFSGTAVGATLAQQRQDFLWAEKHIAQGDEPLFLSLADVLADYPLYPYLQYQWLKNNLAQSEKIQRFLTDYKNTRYAELLRAKWLAYLADNAQWLAFSQHYQATGDAALECQYHWAQYQLGRQQFALEAAKRLWAVGYAQAKACDPLLSALVLSPELTPSLIWQRFDLALRNNNAGLARYVMRLMAEPTLALAELWLQVHNTPSLLQDSAWLNAHSGLGGLFAYGIERLAKTNLTAALALWDTHKSAMLIDANSYQQVERKLALALARARDSRAFARLEQVVAGDAEVREWKVRAALLELNWPHIAKALAGLSLEERQQPQWQYWQARALVATGQAQQGLAAYQQLAVDRSFYGFLAADAIQTSYALNDKPILLAPDDASRLAQQSDFRVVQEWVALNRPLEAKRQWWFAIQKLPKEQLKIAAKLAQQWQWDQIAIMTLVKADYWDDLGLRFPMAYLSQVQNTAQQFNVDPALIYGLMRQESLLDTFAQSPVGARGLMQLMPGTGQQMARALNEPWLSEASLFNPAMNIRYGTRYYQELLGRFGGHVALASAAYNAGPNRIAKWLPTASAVPADVWIETIPYKETRKYVSSVLAYAMVYQQRLQRNALKLSQLLVDVPPR